MAQQRALPQSKETLLQSYNKRLKDDIKSIMDNFTEIIKTAKVRERPLSCAWDSARRGGVCSDPGCHPGPLPLRGAQPGSSLGWTGANR